jgi:hypothetical protein
MHKKLLTVIAVASLSACTWVKMEPGGKGVRVARLGDDLSACTKRGEVAVSVRDKVGLYQRNELKVRDELETMARNEATGLDADTVQAANEPSAGEQRYVAYSCGRNAPIARGPARSNPAEPLPRESGDAETFPMRDD